MSTWTSTPPEGKGNDSSKWEINYDAEGSVSAQAIFDENGRVVAFAVARSGNWMANPSVDHANLIASAPELLEALQKIVALEDTEKNEWDAVERVLPEAIAIARAAIAKAEGRS